MPNKRPYELDMRFEEHDFDNDLTIQLTQSMPSHERYAQPLFDADVNTVALLQKKAGYRRLPEYHHGVHHVMLVVQGALHLSSGDHHVVLTPGMMAFCPSTLPMARHCQVPVLFVSLVVLDSPRWEPLKNHGFYSRQYDHMEMLIPPLCGLMAAKGGQTAKEQIEALEYSRFLADLLKRERRYVATRELPPTALELKRLVSRISEKPEQDWTLLDMANAVGISKRSLGRLVRQEYGSTPMELVMKHRVEAAARLLTRSGMKISEIAEALNYRSTASFSELFVRYTGKRPGQFRREFRNGGKSIG